MDAAPELTLHNAIEQIDGEQWNVLAGDDNPFVSYEFLRCLESFGAAVPEHGWQTSHATLTRYGQLIAAAPIYTKFNSHGEFVFDWAWASAWERAGGQYYPKLLCAAPYSPIQGPRLLATDVESGQRLVEDLIRRTEDLRYSSLHFNFVNKRDADILTDAGLLERNDCQFHWHNQGYRCFDEFLARLTHKRRKEIRRERRAVAKAGIHFHWVDGGGACARDIDDAESFYRHTFEEKGNIPVIGREAWEALAAGLKDRLLFLFAERDAQRVAAAIFLRDHDSLYGRYWGCLEEIRFLHFETCLYQGIDLCIEQGLARFEPGAQGEHKFMRGFEPVQTQSFHWIGPAPLRNGVADYLRRERKAVHAYREDLSRHSPYRRDDASC